MIYALHDRNPRTGSEHVRLITTGRSRDEMLEILSAIRSFWDEAFHIRPALSSVILVLCWHFGCLSLEPGDVRGRRPEDLMIPREGDAPARKDWMDPGIREHIREVRKKLMQGRHAA